jgi:hypothetical protein
MSYLFAFLVALASCTAAAASTVGTHGMVLFGGADGLYASHLPMYHAPHDYQVVLRVHLADPAQDAALRARLEQQVTLWTLDPEKFAIDRLAPAAAMPLKTFKAGVVLGHFEQGGALQTRDAQFVIDKVLHFRQLPMEARAAQRASYLQFGGPQRRYLVKLIESRPDYDHIFALDTRPGQGRVLGTIYYGTDDLR